MSFHYRVWWVLIAFNSIVLKERCQEEEETKGAARLSPACRLAGERFCMFLPLSGLVGSHSFQVGFDREIVFDIDNDIDIDNVILDIKDISNVLVDEAKRSLFSG
ncbi:hypothetical protein Taro_053614 [Colocasia esculenta]|uniref:Uncharacterized protein n=1 Tax=Colocasia esculenta TaxID=4460 RepID=A0A843XNB7_COLES|nr:hypothetical protein [Colocasia esculenta]